MLQILCDNCKKIIDPGKQVRTTTVDYPSEKQFDFCSVDCASHINHLIQ